MLRLRPESTYLAYSLGEGFFFQMMSVLFSVFLILDLGFGPMQLLLMGTAVEGAYLLFEVPTGVVADTVSRRLSVVVGLVGTGAAFLLLGASGSFAVTGEIVPPRAGGGAPVTQHARALVGSIDAANVTDNPTASAHMSAVAGCAFVAEAGIEPTLQLTCRDRNRLAITSDLLGAWALGARNVLCLSGDPISVGDEPDARPANDVTVLVDEVHAYGRKLRTAQK